MGRYLEIARKFEDARVHSDLHQEYQQAAGELQTECFAVDSLWLIDAHPEVWEEIKRLDDTLTRLELVKADESLYRQALGRLVATVHKAWALAQNEQIHPQTQ